jgi:hypothetical protein
MASDISLAVGDGARRMTYAELATVRGISPASAKRLTQRHRWVGLVTVSPCSGLRIESNVSTDGNFCRAGTPVRTSRPRPRRAAAGTESRALEITRAGGPGAAVSEG